MAFEAFRAQSEAPARSRRKALWYAVSIAFHGALIAAGVAYSFWHIEELSPPRLKLTFMSAAPPPPPAAPAAAAGGQARKKIQIKPKAVTLPKTELVQPRETPKQEPPKEAPTATAEDQGDKGGDKGGKIGGAPNGTALGTVGGTGTTPGGKVGAPPAPSKFLPPNIGEGQKLSGGKPDFPPSLRKPGAVYRLLVKVYVDVSGNVEKLTLMKGDDPLLNQSVLEKLKTWKFRPFMVNGIPAPFSYPQAIEFRTE
jgi:protein TonB